MTIDPRFMIDLKGRSFVLYAGLLDAATSAGLKALTATVLQVPAPENGHTAVVTARAEFADGRVFEDVGDASPANCSAQMAPAALRLASTRGKARVLRDALNVGVCSLEELPDDERQQAAPAAPAPAPRAPAPVNGNGRAADNSCEGCGVPLRAAQVTFTRQRYGRAACIACQKQLTPA